jgi:SAM-dependent methyltransferase
MERREVRQSGRDFFNHLFNEELLAEAKWLEYGAADKADSVEYLLQQANIPIQSLLEIGCGTGAILRELQRRSVASELFGIDYSQSAIDYAKSLSSGIHYDCGDVTTAFSLPRNRFDAVVISHVLEHLEDPQGFLRALHHISFRVLVAEVPLEDLLAARIKNLFRDRRMNRAGHVQFFTAGAFVALLRSAGFTVSGDRHYCPIQSLEALHYASSRNHFSPLRKAVATATGHYLPRYAPFYKHFYHAHYAVLCHLPSSLPSHMSPTSADRHSPHDEFESPRSKC